MMKLNVMPEKKWNMLRFGEVKVATDGGKYVFLVEVYLGGHDPTSVRVELYADRVNGGEPELHEMRRGEPLSEANSYTYSAQVTTTRPATDYTARVIPQHDSVAVPLEAARILWQH